MATVPAWNPLNPGDYLQFIKWWWTYSDRINAANSKEAKLDLTQRYDSHFSAKLSLRGANIFYDRFHAFRFSVFLRF
jgi:hypothetical protein